MVTKNDVEALIAEGNETMKQFDEKRVQPLIAGLLKEREDRHSENAAVNHQIEALIGKIGTLESKCRQLELKLDQLEMANQSLKRLPDIRPSWMA